MTPNNIPYIYFVARSRNSPLSSTRSYSKPRWCVMILVKNTASWADNSSVWCRTINPSTRGECLICLGSHTCLIKRLSRLNVTPCRPLRSVRHARRSSGYSTKVGYPLDTHPWQINSLSYYVNLPPSPS